MLPEEQLGLEDGQREKGMVERDREREGKTWIGVRERERKKG